MAYLGSGGHAVFQFHAIAQSLEGFFIWFAFDLNPIRFRGFVLGIADPVLQSPVIGQNQQAFAVFVQTASGIDPGYINEF